MSSVKHLKATAETVHFGFHDGSLKPVLEIDAIGASTSCCRLHSLSRSTRGLFSSTVIADQIRDAAMSLLSRKPC